MISPRLLAPDEALARLLAGAAPLPPVSLPAGEAVGRVLAAPIRAARAVPAGPVALRAGWAVAASDTLGASPYSPAPLSGGAPRALRPGDALPPGTDAVLPPVAAALEGPLAAALEQIAPGEGARGAGEDIALGAVLREAGERLRPRDLPALEALGVGEVTVRIPRLWLDPALPLLAAFAAAAGAELAAGAEGRADLAAVAGGPEALDEVLAEGLGARPGEAVALGRLRGVPALALPPRAEEAAAAWFFLLLPALAALSGAAPAPPLRLALARKVASAVGLADLVPLRRLPDGRAEPLAVGAIPLFALCAADAMLLVPPASEGQEAGAEVAALAF